MQNLKKIRLDRKLTQKELAEKSGISQSTICEVENGKHDCSVTALKSICDVLEVTPNDVLGY